MDRRLRCFRTTFSKRDWFTRFTALALPINIVLGDNSAIHGTGIGRIAVQMMANGKWVRAVLQDVIYVPELHGNILSVSQLTRRGPTFGSLRGGVKFMTKLAHSPAKAPSAATSTSCPSASKASESARVAIAHLDHFPAYDDDLPSTPADKALVAHGSSSGADALTWHRCLGHLNVDSVLRMVRKGMVEGMELVGTRGRLQCLPQGQANPR